MRLQVEAFEVRGIAFGRKTFFRDGLLSISRKELIGLISDDNRLRHVSVERVSPGENTRITNVNDILEPRVKVDDSEGYYPGILSGLFRAGQGKTRVLKCCSVMEVGYLPGFCGGIVDMAGKGASLTPYSGGHHVCLLTRPASHLDPAEYGRAMKLAAAKASVYLARAAGDAHPDEVRCYDLNLSGGGVKHLPKVGYLFQLHTHGDSREPFIYGGNSRQFYPTILHPNEILDGAVVCGHYDLSMGMKNTTYSILHHPVILDLYERHGKELDFKGVVISPEPNTLEEIHRTSMMAAGLLKHSLAVDGVVITKEGGGHADVDLMRNCEACEKLGIRTVLMDHEWIGPDGSGSISLLDMCDQADAIISLGNVDEVVELPPVERLVGGDVMTDMPRNLRGRLHLPVCSIPEAVSQIGLSRLAVETASRAVRLLSKICNGEPAAMPSEEKSIPGGTRKNFLCDKRASRRAVELLLRKIAGKAFETEIPFPDPDQNRTARPLQKRQLRKKPGRKAGC